MSEKTFIKFFSIDIFKSSSQRELYDYWVSLKKGRTMPSCRELVFEKIPDVLPSTVLIEFIESENEFLIGSVGAVCSYYLGEITGYTINSMDSYENSHERLKWCVENKRPYYATGTLKNLEKEYVNHSSIVLPLSDDGENVNKIIMSNHYY